MSLREDALYEESYALYKTAQDTDTDFNEDNYKWVFGWQAFRYLTSKTLGYIETAPDCIHTYNRIKVDIDLYDDWKVELWKKVTS